MNDELFTARSNRAQRVRARQREVGVDALLLSLGADLPWLTGYEAMPLERPTVLVLPKDGEATLVVPALEAPRVEVDERLFTLRPYAEAEDAISVVAGLVGGRRALAISDRTWAELLLGLQQALPDSNWRRSGSVTGPLRAVKDDREAAALTAAGAAADRVALDLQSGEIPLVGRSEAAVSADISARLVSEGHARAMFSIVGSGPNSASPHHEAGSRQIKPREVVVCDFGGALRLDGDVGYCSDTTRTVVTGEPTNEFRELYECLQLAQRTAVDAVAPGVVYEDIDRAARRVIEEGGFGAYFIHRTGHGIGVEEHEDPYIIEGNRSKAVKGNAFSVEPGIYLPGRFGARIEDIVLVGEDRAVPCNRSDHGLVVVDA